MPGWRFWGAEAEPLRQMYPTKSLCPLKVPLNPLPPSMLVGCTQPLEVSLNPPHPLRAGCPPPPKGLTKCLCPLSTYLGPTSLPTPLNLLWALSAQLCPPVPSNPSLWTQTRGKLPVMGLCHGVKVS